MRIAITVGQLEGPLPAGRHQCGKAYRSRSPRPKPHSGAKSEDRIQYRANAAGERTLRCQRPWIASRVSPADESGPVGLVAYRADSLRSPVVHHVHAPERLLLGRAGATGGADGVTPVVPFGLHEEIAERRMGPVALRGRQHDLSVARQLDLPSLIAVIGDGDPPYLRGVLGYDRDLGAGLDRAIDPVEGHPVGRQQCLVGVRSRAYRLMRGRPDATSGKILEIAELAGEVAGAV